MRNSYLRFKTQIARRVSLYPIGSLLLVILIVLGSCFVATGCSRIYDLKARPAMQFSVEGWNGPMTDTDSIFTGTRLKMVQDLLDTHDFHGWSVTEVETLLGIPKFQEDTESGLTLSYDLRDGLNLLVFELNDQNIVVDYHVHRTD